MAPDNFDKNEFQRILGSNIKKYRSMIPGMTQEKLAEKVGYSTGMIGRLETGATSLSIEKLIQIANALGTGVDNLISEALVDNTGLYLKAIMEYQNHFEPKQCLVILRLFTAFLDTIKDGDFLK